MNELLQSSSIQVNFVGARSVIAVGCVTVVKRQVGLVGFVGVDHISTLACTGISSSGHVGDLFLLQEKQGIKKQPVL